MAAQPTARRRARGAAVLAALVVALVVLVVIVAREGPDRTVVGTAIRVEPHQLCVAQAGGRDVCVFVDAPQQLDDVAVDDCVRVRYSSEEILVSVSTEPGACS
ncbi:MAG TPA: hypothetical protein VFU14_18000 [Acidimicrobiales bacterium]|nr:hypothetical protein [Acidimicrobiales bacterium]